MLSSAEKTHMQKNLTNSPPGKPEMTPAPKPGEEEEEGGRPRAVGTWSPPSALWQATGSYFINKKQFHICAQPCPNLPSPEHQGKPNRLLGGGAPLTVTEVKVARDSPPSCLRVLLHCPGAAQASSHLPPSPPGLAMKSNCSLPTVSSQGHDL